MNIIVSRMINQPLTIRKAEQYGKYVSLIPFSEKVSGVTPAWIKVSAYGLYDGRI